MSFLIHVQPVDRNGSRSGSPVDVISSVVPRVGECITVQTLRFQVRSVDYDTRRHIGKDHIYVESIHLTVQPVAQRTA